MGSKPIVFAMANPDPEITYEDASVVRGDLIMATGRSDYPNQVIDHPEPELVVEAFRAGAKGIFTCYESQFDALCKCISCVHSGQVWANALQLNCLIDAVAQVPAVRLVNAKGANLLSKREEEVVRQVAEGLSNHDIAQQLHLSDHTVKNHLFHIFEKLGISNRVELVLYTVSHSKRRAMSVSRDDSPAVMPGSQTL